MSDIVMKHYGIKTDADIVERLRDWDRLTVADAIKAAAEIERLRHPKIVVGSRELWEAMGLVVARSDALEEAAKVAEDFYHNQTYGISIAAAIRALKEK